jgi:hypothetical protein
MYKVYCIDSKTFYRGMSLVAADDAEEANAIIDKFVEEDNKNACDSWGYMHVNEADVIVGVYSKEKGIVHYGIYYSG